jgi:hypothetical protein
MFRSIALTLMTCLVATAAQSAPVTVNFDIDLETRTIIDGSGHPAYDQSFTPFSTSASLTFDDTWISTGFGSQSYPDYEYQHADVYFAGNNKFVSPLTSTLPWAPSPTNPGRLERNIAYFGYDSFDPPGIHAPVPVLNGMLWDDRSIYDDGVSMEYRYYIALLQSGEGADPVVSDPLTFQTAELLEYLHLLKDVGQRLTFGEGSTASNYLTGSSEAIEYSGHAVITSVVPVPPAVWLFGSALGVMGVVRRKISS